MKLRLADTSVRMYRKSTGQISYRYRSYLIANTNIGFSMSYYLKDASISLRLVDGETIEFEEVSISDCTLCPTIMNSMVHDLRAFGLGGYGPINNGVGKLRFNYHLNFTGSPMEEPETIEYVVPLIKRAT